MRTGEDTMLIKQCHKCAQVKPQAEFWKDKASPDGLWNRCKDCGRLQNLKTYQANQAAELERNQTWRDKHRPQVRQRKILKRDARIQWLVYRLDFLDGCYYIGSTNDLSTRLSLHRWEMRQGLHRNSRIRSKGYGPADFTVAVVAEVPTEQEARRTEGQTIDRCFSDVACLNLQRVSYCPAA